MRTADGDIFEVPHQAPGTSPTSQTWTPLSFAAMGLFLLACAYTAYFTRDILLPVTAALVLSIVLSPVARRLTSWHIPPALGAAVIVSSLLVAFITGIAALSEPVAEWRFRAPQVIEKLDQKIGSIRRSVEDVKKASKKVEDMADMESETQQTPEVVVKTPDLMERFLGGLQNFGAQLAVVIILLYFILASGNLFTEKLIRVLPRLSDKKRALAIAQQVERTVSTYLFTITLINIGFGLAVGAALYFLNMPNPMVWAAMATLLNFVPYIGAVIGTGIVAGIAVVSFDTLALAALPPLSYIGLNVLESQFITPSILGRRFTLNPVVIFTSIMIWSWLWGVPGALLAVPLLVILKALCDHIEALGWIGEFMRGRDGPARALEGPPIQSRQSAETDRLVKPSKADCAS